MDKLLSSCFLTWPIYLSSESAQKLTSRWCLQNSLFLMILIETIKLMTFYSLFTGTKKPRTYKLREGSVKKREEMEVRKTQPRKRGPKPRPKTAPMSKYRRRTANLRERMRMGEINVAFCCNGCKSKTEGKKDKAEFIFANDVFDKTFFSAKSKVKSYKK